MNLKQVYQVKTSNNSRRWRTENKWGNKEIDIASIGILCTQSRMKIFPKCVVRTKEGT